MRKYKMAAMILASVIACNKVADIKIEKVECPQYVSFETTGHYQLKWGSTKVDVYQLKSSNEGLESILSGEGCAIFYMEKVKWHRFVMNKANGDFYLITSDKSIPKEEEHQVKLAAMQAKYSL